MRISLGPPSSRASARAKSAVKNRAPLSTPTSKIASPADTAANSRATRSTAAAISASEKTTASIASSYDSNNIALGQLDARLDENARAFVALEGADGGFDAFERDVGELAGAAQALADR